MCVCVCVRVCVWQREKPHLSVYVPTSTLKGRLHTHTHTHTQTHTLLHNLALALLAPWVVLSSKCLWSKPSLIQLACFSELRMIYKTQQQGQAGRRKSEEIFGLRFKSFRDQTCTLVSTSVHMCISIWFPLRPVSIPCLCLFFIRLSSKTDVFIRQISRALTLCKTQGISGFPIACEVVLPSSSALFSALLISLKQQSRNILIIICTCHTPFTHPLLLVPRARWCHFMSLRGGKKRHHCPKSAFNSLTSLPRISWAFSDTS